MREGGVGENASYYIFTQAADGAFEAFPVEEWYNFKALQRYKSLTIEEAEEEFNSRSRTLNLFSVMVRKRMTKNDADPDAEDDAENGIDGKVPFPFYKDIFILIVSFSITYLFERFHHFFNLLFCYHSLFSFRVNHSFHCRELQVFNYCYASTATQ